MNTVTKDYNVENSHGKEISKTRYEENIILKGNITEHNIS